MYESCWPNSQSFLGQCIHPTVFALGTDSMAARARSAAPGTPVVATAAGQPTVAETAPMTSAMVLAGTYLRPTEHMIIVDEDWLRLPLVKRTARRPPDAAAHRIAKTLADDTISINEKFKLAMETAMRDTEMWSMVRDIMNVNQQVHVNKVVRERKRMQKEIEEAEAARQAQERHDRNQRQRVLRAVDTDELNQEQFSRRPRG